MGKPFSIGYVLKTTIEHMQKSIEISVRKTLERIGEFANDREKSEEIFKTLATLHSMRKQLDEFQSKHSKDIKGE
jgi:hypothetical protein